MPEHAGPTSAHDEQTLLANADAYSFRARMGQANGGGADLLVGARLDRDRHPGQGLSRLQLGPDVHKRAHCFRTGQSATPAKCLHAGTRCIRYSTLRRVLLPVVQLYACIWQASR
jgi:hypothetical protein